MQRVVGRVIKAHGVHGEVSVEIRTDSPDERFVAGAVLVAKTPEEDTRSLTVSDARMHGERLLIRFTEITDRTSAEELRRALLLVNTDDLRELDDPDEFYDHELEGLHAEFADGTPIGRVRDVVHSPSGALLALDRSGREVLVPFVTAIVPEVDVAGGRIVLDPPEGLLDI